MWRYSLRWRYPHFPCSGEPVLVSEDVCEGAPVPDSILSRFIAGGDYVVCLDFLSVQRVKRWPPERKAQARLRNLRRRILMLPWRPAAAFSHLKPFIAACSGHCRAAGTVPARAETLMMSRCSTTWC